MNALLRGFTGIFDGMITIISAGICSGSIDNRQGLPDYYDLPPKEADRMAMMLDREALRGDWQRALGDYRKRTATPDQRGSEEVTT